MEEEGNLREGVRMYGQGKWAQILQHFNFNGRNAVDLKDKWRNINK